MDRHCTNTAVRDKDWLRIIPIAYFFGSYVRNDGMNEPGWHYLVPQGHHFTVEHLVSIPLSLCRLRLRESGKK